MTPDDKKKLISLFPHSYLKDQFSTKANKEDIAEAKASLPDSDIKELFHADFENCKHHTYILDAGSPITQLPNFEILNVSPEANQLHHPVNEALYFIPVTFVAIFLTNNGPVNERINFQIPVKVTFSGQYVIVKTVLMSKKAEFYARRKNGFIKSVRTIHEFEIVDSVKKSFGAGLVLNNLDIHRGVKAIWARGDIDSPAANFKYDCESTKSVLDKGKYLRADRVNRYNEIVQSTMGVTLFHGFNDNIIPSVFATNPSTGMIYFSSYPNCPTLASNVITEIISAN